MAVKSNVTTHPVGRLKTNFCIIKFSFPGQILAKKQGVPGPAFYMRRSTNACRYGFIFQLNTQLIFKIIIFIKNIYILIISNNFYYFFFKIIQIIFII